MDASRRRFLKNAALASGAIALAPSALAACSSSPGTASSGPSAAPSLVKPKGKVTLNLWTWAWPTEPLATQYKQAFEAAYPQIDLQVKMFTYPDYTTALVTAMPVGQAGHVLHLETGSLLRQYAKFLTPLDSYATSAWGSAWDNAFIGGSVKEIQQSVSDGELYALPQEYSVGGVTWVNNPVLTKVGATLPGSYSDLVSTASALRAKNLSAVAWGAKDQWPNTDYLIQFASQWEPGVVQAAEAGKASFTNDAIVNALNFMKRSMQDGIYNKAPFSMTAFPEAYNNFFYGQSAFTSSGTWGVNLFAYEKVSASPYAAFLFPQLPDTPTSNWLGGLATGSPAAPTGTSPVRPWRTVNVATAMRNDLDADTAWAAWKFIEYWCGPEGQKVGASTFTPARTGLRPPLAAEWVPIYDWQTSLAAFAERRQFDFAETRTAIQDAIANVCVNGANAKTELAKVDAAAAIGRQRNA